jgi:aromatic amino acid aminotransferase I / 2-aminoadipate transaminase
MAPHASNDVEITGVTDTQAIVIPDPILSNGATHPVFTIDDVLRQRQKSAPLPATVAAFSSADMFKSKSAFLKPKARRWDHRISNESRARKPSSLKGAMKHFRPDMISLCGGLPSRYESLFETRLNSLTDLFAAITSLLRVSP